MQFRSWKMAGWAAAAIVIACSSDSIPGIQPDTASSNRVAQITVTLPSPELRVGQTALASATAKKASGAEVSRVSLVWSSSNPAVASVDPASGSVTAVSVGSATITATVDNVTGSATLTVVPVPPTPVANVGVSLLSSSILAGAATQATAAVSDQNGAPLQGRTVTWASSNTAVASVNANGIVVGTGAGTANITATSEGVVGTAVITVTAPVVPVFAVSVSLGASSIAPNATTQATATTWDASSNVLIGRAISWTSSNTAVATVSASGVVTGVASGSATISATSEGKTGTAAVNVTTIFTPVASVNVSLGSSSLVVGATTTATAVTRDANNAIVSGRVIAWSSSNTSVATVNASTGLVAAVAAGTANITATSEGKSGSSTVTVTAAPPIPVATVTVSLGASNIVVAATTTATAVTKDANGNVLGGRVIAWSSSNTAVATVDVSTGVVTGVAAGTANITATSEGKTGSSTVTVTAPLIPVASVTASLGSSSIVVGTTTVASAVTRDANGALLTGRVVTWSSSNTAVATVNTSTGVVTGIAAGSANIIATSEGVTGSALLTVTAPVIPVASVTASLGSSSIVAGTTTTATAVTKDVNGNVLTGRAIAWSSSNTAAATVNASTGVVTGVAAGTANIIATSEGQTGGATLTVTAPPPPVATQLAITTQPPASVQSGATLSPSTTVELRSASNAVVAQAGVVVIASIATGTATLGGTLTATTNASGVATFSNLNLTGSGAQTLRFSATGLAAATSTSITVNSSSSATILFSENFEDTNLGGRGWYDLTGVPLSTIEHIPGSTRSMQWQFSAGATNPVSGGNGRHAITPTDRVYISYWVKYSSNWIGSGAPYHPHEFYLLTTEDPNAYNGLAYTRLTAYVEDNFSSGSNGASVLGIQDGMNIDVTKINQNLINVTESRAVSGCNGSWDGAQQDCYPVNNLWFNGRTWKASQTYNATTKNQWHKVEAYFQLNTISGGKGQMDGLAQVWVDGQQVLNAQNAMYRTATHPNMKFNQFIMAAYMGDGSPTTQTMWIDDLIVMNGKPF